MTPMADSILPSIISMCEENGVYLAITFRNIRMKTLQRSWKHPNIMPETAMKKWPDITL